MKLRLLVLVLTLQACSLAPCREVKTQSDPTAVGPVTEKGVKDQEPQTPKSPTTLVFKYDGTRQCGEGNPISIEDMALELREVRILSKFTGYDGLMRTQVCGAATGQAHVFEIPSTELPKALSAGFKQWTFGKPKK